MELFNSKAFHQDWMWTLSLPTSRMKWNSPLRFFLVVAANSRLTSISLWGAATETCKRRETTQRRPILAIRPTQTLTKGFRRQGRIVTGRKKSRFPVPTIVSLSRIMSFINSLLLISYEQWMCFTYTLYTVANELLSSETTDEATEYFTGLLKDTFSNDSFETDVLSGGDSQVFGGNISMLWKLFFGYTASLVTTIFCSLLHFQQTSLKSPIPSTLFFK